MQWQTLRGSTDLPGFVEHLSDANFKVGLRGTIRMETPVLYFYSPREATVSVHVAFSKGVITEWYPHAARTEPSDARLNTDLRQLHSDGNITWSGVVVSPELIEKFPHEARSNRYYSARETAQRIGYRITGATADEVVLQPPELTGNLESLLADLERVLVDQGLYPDEAHAMVETWRDSCFNAVEHQDKSGRPAGEVSFLPRSFSRSLAIVCGSGGQW
jgi:hypothetical protein